jgi:hypothetical protein
MKLSVYGIFTLSILPFLSLADETDAVISATEQKQIDTASISNPVKSTAEDKSPWLFAPLVSSSPKLSTTVGGMVGYMKTFDKKSPASMFGLTGNYSNTDSYTVVGFAKAYFDENNQRITTAIVRGEINNDYDDFLGSGYPLKTTDSISVGYMNWAYRVYDDWFAGVQGINTNYHIYSGEDIPTSNLSHTNYTLINKGANATALESIAGFESKGLGLSVEFDSRNRPRSATSGQYFKVGNIAYRESLGGDESFDSYRAQYNYYLGHGNGSVLAININGQYKSDAPTSAYASIKTKGYTSGQYLAPYVTSLQIDERYSFNEKWGMVAYAAVACLHGTTEQETLSCSDSENIFPSVSLGMFYALKPKAGVIVRMEGAYGKDNNKGFYMSLGHPF